MRLHAETEEKFKTTENSYILSYETFTIRNDELFLLIRNTVTTNRLELIEILLAGYILHIILFSENIDY